MRKNAWLLALALVCVPVAMAQYHNDCSTTTLVDNPLGGTLTVDSGALKLAVTATGYAGIRFNAANGAPINMLHGTITATLKYEGPFTGSSVFWFRAMNATWNGSSWVNVTHGAWPFNYDYAAGGWQTFTACVDDCNNFQYYCGSGTCPWDPGSISYMRLDSVFWDAGQVPYAMYIDDLDITIATPPVANAGVDQSVAGTCGQFSSVTLDGSATTNGANYFWSEGGTQIATGVTPQIQLAPGKHYIVLLATDAAGCAKSTDSVLITVGGAKPLPVEEALDSQVNYGYGDAITGADGISGLWFEDPLYSTPLNCARVYPNGGGWYYGPYVDLTKLCYGAVDLTDTDIHFTGKFFQDADNFNTYVFGDPNDPNTALNPYDDAPIFVRLRDSAGKAGNLGILYPAFQSSTVPPAEQNQWKTISMAVAPIPHDPNYSGWDLSDIGFDVTKVVRVEFFGTDWGGLGTDHVNVKDLWIGSAAPAFCTGDLNCDGKVSFADINPFVQYLSANAAWQAAFPGCNPVNGDINQDSTYGQGSFGDINPFVAVIVNCASQPGGFCTCN